MCGMRLYLAVLAVMLGTSTVMADSGAALDRTDAFEQTYGASFFEFDACGEGLSGRIYRQALTDRVMTLVHSPMRRRPVSVLRAIAFQNSARSRVR